MWFHCDAHKDLIRKLTEKGGDITSREIACGNESITLLFIKQLTDRSTLSDFIIRPLMEYCASAKKPPKAKEAVETVLFIDDCRIEPDEEKLEGAILAGMAVLLFSNDKASVVANVKKVEHRHVPEPELSYNARSPKDCFLENLDSNLSLLRYRLHDKNLRIQNMEIGERTKTRVALAFIDDIADDRCVAEIRKRIGGISVDGIMSSGELQAFLQNSKASLFPEMMSIERSDMAADYLLKGKVVLIVDGSPQALAAPTAFVEFMYTCDDRYDNKFFGLFMRLVRFGAFFLSFTASSYWVAIVDFHSDVLPAGFIINLAEARSKVPFSALLGVLLLEFTVELIRESLLRVPNKIGSAIGIVSAIIIGQAAISAGVFSPLLLILISIEFLASFAIPNQTAANPFRMIKFLLLLITSMFGFFGFILGITVVVVQMVSINSFGVPYLAPYGPFNLYDFFRTFMFNKTTAPKRMQYMRNKDDTRTGSRNKDE